VSRIDLDLFDVIALDKVQKKKALTDDEFKSLKAKGLVEGRRPHLFVSAKIADATGERASYIKNRALDREYYKKLIESYLDTYKHATRSDIETLLMSKLSDALEEHQKKYLVNNLLQEMRKEGRVQPHGSARWTKWTRKSSIP
jgi:ATP-dependent DNA helicase RecG